MRITVTGATGYVAGFVVAELVEHHELTLFTRTPVDSPSTVVVGDITDPNACLEAVDGADAVVHLAVEATDKHRMFPTNVEGTYQMACAAATAGVRRFVMASTFCVYGNCLPGNPFGFKPVNLPMNELQPRDPHEPYGFTKLTAEHVLRYVARRDGLEAMALRLSWVWAEREVAWWIDTKKMDLERMQHNYWGYVDARDVASAVRLAVETPEAPTFDPYNISAADTVADLPSADLISRFYPNLVELAGGLKGNESLFSWGKANSAFGYRPEHSWKEYL